MIYLCGIYKITNKINGKVYIGQAINIHYRFTRHKNDAFDLNNRQYHSALYQAIRKYGIENFIFEVIEECAPDKLDEKEIHYIAQYESFGPKGYNLTPGGRSAIVINIPNDIVSLIINRLKTTEDTYENIAKDYNLKPSTVHHINNGKCAYRETESYPIRERLGVLARYNNYCAVCGKRIEKRHTHCVKCSNTINNFKSRRAIRPDSKELAKLVLEVGFVQAGRQFGVSDNAIKKWLYSAGIPNKKKELEKWYCDKFGPLPANKRERTPITEIVKPVKQIDLQTGKLIKVFSSAHAAGIALGKSNGNHIAEVCKGLLPQAYGYFWQYA